MTNPIDIRFWYQNSPISLRDRICLIELRAKMPVRDRDLVSADIIHLFHPVDLNLRDTPQGRSLIIARAQLAMEAEIRRGKTGHWAYDSTRHQALKRIVDREKAAIASLMEAAE